KRCALPFQFVPEINFEVDRSGISHRLIFRRVLAAISNTQPAGAAFFYLTVELPRFARQIVLDRKRAARAEWAVDAKVDHRRPAPRFRFTLKPFVNLYADLN